MAEYEKEEFKFPDETTQESNETRLEIEIEDDTPPEDQGRTPADPKKVRELEVEVDDLDKYSKEAKDKLIRMKRVWNDDRRARESAEREREAAIEATQRLHSENQRLKSMLTSGEQEYVTAVKSSSEMQLEMAKRAYREAYDSGDSEKIVDAQQAMNLATLQLERVRNFKLPSLQDDNNSVQIDPNRQVQQNQPPRDYRLEEWQGNNSWFGQDEEMTAAALGLHEKLKRTGVVPGSEKYYAELDNTMRRRFPESFNDDLEPPEVEESPREDNPRAKPSTVVAPATRTTAPKKVRLKTSQIAIAKKLGLTPEQYVRELLKLEA